MQQRTRQVMALRWAKEPGEVVLPQARRQGMAHCCAVWKVGKGTHLHRFCRVTGHCGARCGGPRARSCPFLGDLLKKAFGVRAPQWPQGDGQMEVMCCWEVQFSHLNRLS